MKLWGGRFTKGTDKWVEEFTSSIAVDCRMYREDIAGSKAHARMLAKCGIIEQDDEKKIIDGLDAILDAIEDDNFSFDVALEDIHMNIEKRLTDIIGEAGGRLHTARSRNDQVALDMHLYMKREIIEIGILLVSLQSALVDVADKNQEVIMPGYTHLQRAQPILFAHHMMAYFFMLSRDFDRLKGVWERADMMPLGAGALAGTTYPTDAAYVAEQLKFGSLYDNSLDAVSDRDYVMEFLSFASIAMVHLSRLSEEIILWSSSEFRFIELDDAHCTGSSIMPQKKNPDVSELVRGKTGRVFGNLVGLLTVMKGLPLAYNKDLQEDKEGFFDTIDTLKFSLRIYTAIVREMKVCGDRMQAVLNEDFSNATDMADYLVKKGLPFRQAHEVTGLAVRYCIDNRKWLTDLTLEEFKQFSALFDADILAAIRIEECVKNRKSHGGTAPQELARQLKKASDIIKNENTLIDYYTKKTI